MEPAGSDRPFRRFDTPRTQASEAAAKTMGSSLSNGRAAPAPPPPPHRLHVMDADEEDENVKQLSECAALYLSLQDCLAESNRNWKACQAHVQALKACEAKRNKSETK